MSNSEGVEHLDSVHDNPFVRKFGIDLSHREPKANNVRKASVDSLTTADNDSEQEYHVNSGFVNKLRSKFTQLQNESSHKVTLSRKSASLENLLSESHYSSSNYGNRTKGQRNVTYDDSHTSKRSDVQLRKKPTTAVKLYSRPRSSDEVLASGKPPIWKKKDSDTSTQNHFVRGAVKPPIPKKKDSAAVRQSRNSASEITKHKIEHHDWKVAPDLEKIGRDNIVIIESSSPCIKRKNDKTEQPIEKPEKSERKEDFRHVRPVRDKPTDENELPKPNTVSAFRSLFENTKKASDVIHSWRNQSPTRTSAGSESPNVSSPVSTPRSPLVRMNDENVFETSIKSVENNKKERVYSPRNSYNNDSSSLAQSPRNSSAEIVDMSSTSMQTSLEVFEAAKNDKQQNDSRSFTMNKHAHTEAEDKPLSPTPLSPRIAAGLLPEHPLTNIFDSKSVVKPDKPKRPKPAVIARKQHIPKDTIELKHEADKKKHPALPNLVIKQDNNKILEKSEPETDTSANQQSNDTRSGRSSGKISPRKTQIFDSSNIVKKDRPPPKISSSPTEKKFRSSPVSDETSKVSAEIKSRKESKEPNVSTNQIEQNKEFKDPQTGIKLIKTNIVVKNESGSNKEVKEQTKTKFKAPMVPYEGEQKESAKQRSKPVDDTTSPVTGMSSYLANKLKKNQPEANGTTPALTNGSLPSPAPRKRQAPGIPIINGTIKSTEIEAPSPPPLPVSPEPELPKTNIDDIMKRKKKSAQGSNKMVFDSSNIVKKKKETPTRKPIRKTLEELNKNVMSEPTVPLLDLSSLTNDKPDTEYQEGYIPTEIKPCPFKFIGAEVTFESSPFKKRRKAGVKLSFDDKATKTFEYEAEDTALENYLQDHPEEREEAERQEEEDGPGFMASIQSSQDLINDTPMAPDQEPATSMKSNTVIGMSAGALTNYKSKIQVQEFQFGVSQEPEIFMLNNVTNDETDENSMDLLPADSSDLDAFSAETGKADLLF